MSEGRCLSVLVVLLLHPCLSSAQVLVNTTCSANLVCVDTFKGSGDSVSLYLQSNSRKPVSFRLFFTTDNLQHLNPDRETLNGPARKEILSFPQPAGKWGYEYRIHYGHKSYQHDRDHVYLLPFASDRSYTLTQSHTNLSTHRYGNRYALDWGMPIGDSVHAARGGRVVSTYDVARVPDDTNSRGTANHIWIQHDDGTIGKYLHLDRDGIEVSEGDSVGAGQRIGSSGSTGFSSGPHLHFSVSTLGGEYLYETFNLRFKTGAGVQHLTGGVRYSHLRETIRE